MLPDMSCYYLAMLGSRIVEDPLDQIIAILVAGNINQWNSSAVSATFADTIKVATQKLSASDLETFLDNFGGELIGAVLCRVPNHMVNSSASVGRSTVLAYVLNAPVSKLAMSHDIDVGKDLFNARALDKVSQHTISNRFRI